jgi:hypothetical protein
VATTSRGAGAFVTVGRRSWDMVSPASTRQLGVGSSADQISATSRPARTWVNRSPPMMPYRQPYSY